MAVLSFNSVLGFNSRATYQHVPWSGHITLTQKASHFLLPFGTIGSKQSVKGSKSGFSLLVANDDGVETETSDKGSIIAENSFSDDVTSVESVLNSSSRGDKFQANAEVESGPLTSEASNGPIVSSELKQNTSFANKSAAPRRSPLTAREKLRAARVLSRYAETKTLKTEFGSKVLEALKESDKGKRKSGLPEAPTNLFDDSKRGLPKQGLTFEFPGGFDVFIIVTSFVLISTLMFATTYFVWKVGAIHFNEY